MYLDPKITGHKINKETSSERFINKTEVDKQKGVIVSFIYDTKENKVCSDKIATGPIQK